MTRELSRTYVEVISVSETSLKNPFGFLDTFSLFSFTTTLFSVRLKLTFGVTNLKIPFVEYAHMDRTHHSSVW